MIQKFRVTFDVSFMGCANRAITAEMVKEDCSVQFDLMCAVTSVKVIGVHHLPVEKKVNVEKTKTKEKQNRKAKTSGELGSSKDTKP